MADLTLPQDTTWKLLAVSNDMMDTQFCNNKFPYRWRSSLAISAFEPNSDDLPEHLCEGRITFLKVTCTITGYQPSKEETESGYITFPDIPTEELNQIIGEYFACYGALLNVAVFPPNKVDELTGYPHIIDVEPKTRDLIQTSTETGDILTSSKPDVKTNKSMTHTQSSQTGWKLNASANNKDKTYSVGGELSHSNTDTEQDNWSVTTDASLERQQTEGTKTDISQLYNLLSSYYIGTNRVQFLMLARPHILQPTDHRTFVQGLRIIEGVQEFLVIVGRPPEMDGLCIEAQLDTGHFPEGLSPVLPKDEYDESEEEFQVKAHAGTGIFSGNNKNIDYVYNVESGWMVDIRPERVGADPGHPGIKMIQDNSNDQAKNSLKEYTYQRIGDASVEVTGKIKGGGLFGSDADFDRTYRVFTRSIQPKPSSGEGKVPIDKLLITSRNLCTCFKSGQECPELINKPIFNPPVPPVIKNIVPIVAEHQIFLSQNLLTPGATVDTRMPAVNELLTQIQKSMSTSWRMPQRRSIEEAYGFLESDYFVSKVKKYLPKEYLGTNIREAPGVDEDIIQSFSQPYTIGEILDMNLSEISQKTGLKIDNVIKLRQRLLRKS